MTEQTARKTSVREARRQYRKYRLAFEQTRDAIIFLERDRIEDCNPAALAMFRVPDVATFVTLDPCELSPLVQPDGRPSRAVLVEHINAAMREGQAFFEWRYVTWGGGAEFPAEVLLSRIDLEQGAFLQAVVRDVSDRKQAERTLREREQELAEAQHIAGVGSWVADFRTGRVRWSDEVYRIFGLPPEEEDVDQETLMAVVHPEDQSRFRSAIAASLRGEPFAVLHRVVRPDGAQRTVREHGRTEFDAAGRPVRMIGTVQDITVQSQLEDQLRHEKVLFEAILRGLPGVFYMLDMQGRFVRWNEQMEAVTGRMPEELDGLDALELIPVEERDHIEESIRQVFAGESVRVESRLCTVDGETPYLFNGLRVELHGHAYLLGVGLDITRQKRLEAILEREASTDRLTGVANRQCFDRELERALALYHRHESAVALLIIDLDYFKSVNDGHGHDIGDQVLVELAGRLVGEIRETDVLARWGDEEFAVLLPNTDVAEACQMAERLRSRVADASFAVVGQVTISVGLAGACPGDDANTLLKRADDALYEAKSSGRNQVVFARGGADSREC